MTIDEPRLLITGGTGRLGRAARKIFPNALYPGRADMDITAKATVDAYFANHKPEIVIHLAALASIPGCENDKPKAWTVNVQGTRNIIAAAQTTSATRVLLYLQSACIFPGTDPDAMENEDSLPDPKHYYGITKLVAEEAILGAQNDQLKTYSVRTNFTTMPWEYPKAFTDRYGTYLFAQGVVKGLKEILEKLPGRQILHVCGDKKISMYDYAVAGGSQVEPMTLKDYSGPPLTINMSLATKYWRPYKLEDSDFRDE